MRDIKSVKGTARVGQVLQKAAASLGLELEFEGIELDEYNMCLLGSIHKGPQDVLVVSLCYDMKFYTDDPAVGPGSASPREMVMQFLQRLKPNIVAFVDLDEEASHNNFMGRFRSCLDHHLALFHAHDTLVPEGGKKLMHVFEEIYWGRDITSIVGCEGTERRVRPHAWNTWKRMFEEHGFRQARLSPSLAHTAWDMLQSYPPGFGLSYDGGSLGLAWEGTPLSSASAWVPSATKQEHEG